MVPAVKSKARAVKPRNLGIGATQQDAKEYFISGRRKGKFSWFGRSKAETPNLSDVHVQGGSGYWVTRRGHQLKKPEADHAMNAHIHGLRHLVLGQENGAVIVHGLTFKAAN